MGTRPRDGARAAESGMDPEVDRRPAEADAGDEDAVVLSGRSGGRPRWQRGAADGRASRLPDDPRAEGAAGVAGGSAVDADGVGGRCTGGRRNGGTDTGL